MIRTHTRLLASTLIVLLCGSAVVFGQGSAPERELDPDISASTKSDGHSLEIGLSASGDLVLNSASFLTFPGALSCQGDTILFGGSSSPAYSIGARISLMPSGGDGIGGIIGGDVQIGVRSRAGSFEADEQIGQTLLPGDNLSPVVTRYSIDASLFSISVDPHLLIRPSGSDLIVTLGPSFEFPISSNYEQMESLVKPSETNFSDGRSERNVQSGSIESISGMLLSLGLGLSYDIPVSDVISLRPFISGSLGLSKPISEIDWSSHALRLGLSAMLRPTTVESNPLTPN